MNTDELILSADLNRQILYLRQQPIAFVMPHFRCQGCGYDLLDHEETRKMAINGELITGCPYCNKTFCD